MRHDRPGGCPMCGMMMAGGERATPRNEAQDIREQIATLQQRLQELDRGDTSPRDVEEEVPKMCPMCQEMMHAGTERLGQRLEQQIHRLEERVRAVERRAG